MHPPRSHRRLRSLASLVCLAATSACAATLPVRTIAAGETRTIASFGGPLVPKKSPTLVIPYATIGQVRGWRDGTSLVYDAHLTMAAFGVAAADVGIAQRLGPQRGARPELTALSQLYVFAGEGGSLVLPHLALTASWQRGRRQLVYVGADGTAQFSGAPAIVGGPYVGWQFPVTSRLALQPEVKWMAATANTDHGIFKGESNIGGRGALAVQLGATWK